MISIVFIRKLLWEVWIWWLICSLEAADLQSRQHYHCPSGVKPVLIELTDFKTKKVVDTLEVDACLVATGRWVPRRSM